MDFDRLLQHPIPSPNYRPKPNSNRPNLVPQGSGLPTEALTPGLAALVERRQERHDPVIHELAPHLLLADPSRSQNRHLNLHVHRAPEQTSFHVAGRSNHPPSVSSATEDYSDADQAAESRSGDESSTSKNVTNSQRSGRFASPVDLTCGNPATPSNISHHNPRRKRSNESMPESGPSNHSKRRRTSGTLHKQPGGLDRTRTIEEVDLVNDDDDTLSRALQNQRAEQVQSQQGPAGSKTVKLGNLTCTVCLDTPKDLTVTSCGMWIGYNRMNEI